MRQSESRHSSRAELPSDPLSIERIEEQYKGQWVLVKVTAFNDLHTPLEGQVIAHGTRKRINKALAEVVSPGQLPEAPYYFFPAGAFVRPGTEAMRQLIDPSPPQGSDDGDDASGQR